MMRCSKNIKDIYSYLKSNPSLIAAEQHKRSLASFVKDAWQVIEPGQPYVHGWHIDAMCEHLEAVSNNEITRLLINVPPGMMKSLLTSVFFPMWEWGARKKPHYRYLAAAHSQSLAIRDNMKARRLVQSDWYQSIYDIKLTGDQNAKTKFENTSTGFREAMASGSITGSRGDRVIVDDPHSVEGAMSAAKRQTTLDWFCEALPTRLNNPDRSAIIVIMQRLHQDDISGYILEKELGYEHLCLPMEFEEDRRCITSIGFADKRKEEGELLFPERFTKETVERDKKVMGTFATAGQFQQRPSPRDGSIFMLQWFKYYDTIRKYKAIFLSWDTGYKEKELNDPSVCTVWGQHEDGFDLLELYRQRVSYPILKDKVLELHMKWGSDKYLFTGNILVTTLIEDKASGQSLIQDLSKNAINIVPIKPEYDKITRASTCSPIVEQGKIFLKKGAYWLQDFITELTTFPNSKHDDQVDSMSQFLNYYNSRPIMLLTDNLLDD